jgi:hypothetical protein
MGCARREYRSEGTKSSLVGHERTHGTAAKNVAFGSWLCENTGETGWRGKFVQFPEGMIF